MANLRRKTNVTRPKPKPLDENDWLRIITQDRGLHQQMATPRGRLKWLFEFGDRSGELPEDQDQHELACAIGLFMLMTSSGRLGPVAFYFVLDGHEEVMKPAIKSLSIQVGKGIDAIVDCRGAWNISVVQPLTRRITRVISGDRVAVLNWWDAADWTAPFLLAAADAVLAEAPNLGRCAECKRVFVREDPRERFHDKRCATKNRVANWRAGQQTTERKRGPASTKSKKPR